MDVPSPLGPGGMTTQGWHKRAQVLAKKQKLGGKRGQLKTDQQLQVDEGIYGADLFDIKALVDKLLIKEEQGFHLLVVTSTESWWHELTIHPGLPQEEAGVDDDNQADDVLTRHGDDDDES